MKALLAGLVTFAAILFAPVMAGAATINVNTTADEYNTGADCSLREAITAAQDNVSFGGCPAGFGADTINLPGGQYRITRDGDDENANATGDFDITGANELEIRAAGPEARVTVDGNGIDRVFDKNSAGKLELASLRVTGGRLTKIEDGGGIRAGVGMTELENVTVDGNSSAISAGGLAVYAQLLMVNSTVSGNSAGGNGGGLYISGGASATARSSTIYGNIADSDEDGDGFGGGFAFVGDSVNFTNVLNVKNTGTAAVPANNANDCSSGPFYFPRFTMQTQPIGPADCLVGFQQSSFDVSDPGVEAALRYNGGQTPTHNLLPGSPAIGAGGSAAPDECPGVDQNGYGRPAGQCDIGAVQFRPVPSLKIRKVLPKKKVIRRKKTRVITLVVRNSGTGAATGVKACLKLNRVTKKALRFKGKPCRSLGNVPAGGVKRAKIKLQAKRKAARKGYPVRATVRGTGTGTLVKAFKVRVK